MTDEKNKPIPALFATIHFRSERRPNGYTDEQIAELNEAANPHWKDEAKRDDPPAE